MSYLGQVVDNIKLCERRDRSRRVYIASHRQNGEKKKIRPGWEPKALNKTNISGQQRGQEQRAI